MRIYILAIAVFLCSAPMLTKAQDSSSVKLVFKKGNYRIGKEQKETLQEIAPPDSSIILKRIEIIPFSNEHSAENKERKIAYKREKEVIQFLIKKVAIPDTLIKISSKLSYSDTDAGLTIKIYYVAKAEETIIHLKRNKKKLETEFK